MEKTRKLYLPWLLGIAMAFWITADRPSGLMTGVFAQTISQPELPHLPQWVPPSVESIEDAVVVPSEKVSFLPSSVRTALQSFLGQVSDKIISETLQSFLDSKGFNRAVIDAQRNHEPIELYHFAAKRLEESGMIHDFSRHFEFPLQFEPTSKISNSYIRISLSDPSLGILAGLENEQGETVYIIDPRDGSRFKRYEKNKTP